MGTPRMTKDVHGAAIQVLTDDTSVAPVTITVGAASANVALPAGAIVVRMVATVNCYYKWGTSAAVTAAVGDRILAAGTEMKTVPLGMTHLAAIQVSSGGLLEIDAQI